MTDFIERLPVRLAALAGLLVGAASLIAGADYWAVLTRVGLAVFLFGAVGLGLRSLLRGAAHPTKPPRTPPAAPQDSETGSTVDQKTPEMTVDDLK